MARFFIEKEDIRGDVLFVREDAHHILHVLRLGAGDPVTLCDGEGKDYLCRIEAAAEDGVRCRLQSIQTACGEPRVQITLFQGLTKGDKMEWIIEKGVEAGICSFVPLELSRCVSRPDDKKITGKLARWNKISRAAAKQCQRGRIPQVEKPLRLEEAIRRFASFDLVLVCYEEQKDNSLRNILQTLPAPPEKVAVLIGPEGGLEGIEVEKCIEAGARIVGLGPRILRTETAGMITAALVLYEFGQM